MNVQEHWFPQSWRLTLTIVLVKTIFTIWLCNLGLDLQCFSYLLIEFAFFIFQSFYLSILNYNLVIYFCHLAIIWTLEQIPDKKHDSEISKSTTFHTIYNVFLAYNIGGMRKAVGFEIPVIFDASETFDPDVLSSSKSIENQKQDSKAGKVFCWIKSIKKRVNKFYPLNLSNCSSFGLKGFLFCWRSLLRFYSS